MKQIEIKFQKNNEMVTEKVVLNTLKVKNIFKVASLFSKLINKLIQEKKLSLVLNSFNDESLSDNDFLTLLLEVLPTALEVSEEDTLNIISLLTDIEIQKIKNMDLVSLLEIITVVIEINDINGIIKQVKNLQRVINQAKIKK